MASSAQVYWIYWGACFATVITWIFAVAAAADKAWYGDETTYMFADGLGEDCPFWNSKCRLYTAATAFQYMATATVSLALAVVAIAAFAPPPLTGRLGLAVGIMLAAFCLFEMFAFSLLVSFVSAPDDSNHENETGPTLDVAVMAWLLGLVGTITILVLRPRATSDQEGPFRKCMSEGGGKAGGASVEQNVEAVPEA